MYTEDWTAFALLIFSFFFLFFEEFFIQFSWMDYFKRIQME